VPSSPKDYCGRNSPLIHSRWEIEEVGSRETLLVNVPHAGAKGSCRANATLGTPVNMQSTMWHSVGTSYSGCLV